MLQKFAPDLSACGLQKLLGLKRQAVLQCAANMLSLHTAAFAQEDSEHPVWAIKDKYRDDCWHAVGLQVPLHTK